MIASLAMYDLPWLRTANDRLWSAIAERARDAGVPDVPERLTRDADLQSVWRSPALLLGQTCGYPLMTQLRHRVQIVATPRHSAQGCDGSQHRSAIIIRADDPAQSIADLRGRSVGVNDGGSNSGMNLLRAAVAPFAAGYPFFGSVVTTGSHARSFAGVLRGCIDVAAVDAVTLAQLRHRYAKPSKGLRILAWTAASPCLPLITAMRTPSWIVESLQEVLLRVVADGSLKPVLDALLIDGFELLTADDYAPILTHEASAFSLGYPQLA